LFQEGLIGINVGFEPPQRLQVGVIERFGEYLPRKSEIQIEYLNSECFLRGEVVAERALRHACGFDYVAHTRARPRRPSIPTCPKYSEAMRLCLRRRSSQYRHVRSSNASLPQRVMRETPAMPYTININDVSRTVDVDGEWPTRRTVR